MNEISDRTGKQCQSPCAPFPAATSAAIITASPSRPINKGPSRSRRRAPHKARPGNTAHFPHLADGDRNIPLKKKKPERQSPVPLREQILWNPCGHRSFGSLGGKKRITKIKARNVRIPNALRQDARLAVDSRCKTRRRAYLGAQGNLKALPPILVILVIRLVHLGEVHPPAKDATDATKPFTELRPFLRSVSKKARNERKRKEENKTGQRGKRVSLPMLGAKCQDIIGHPYLRVLESNPCKN